jgi:C_GCAxxG_C_C family probable redox protein
MKKSEIALTTFREGFNCSQSVLSAFAPGLGMDRETALKVSCAFGGGMGRMGGTCGAVTGAIMALGLKYGKTKAEDDAIRDKGYGLVREFADKFDERNGSLSCRQLVGCDLSTQEGMAMAKEQNLFELKCWKYVGDAAEILQELLERE